MPEAKLIVLYPTPPDVQAFERVYVEEHMPIARDRIVGKTRIVFSRVLGAPAGAPPFYRVAEIYFPSMEALQKSLATPSSQEAAAHVVAISTGGPPTFLIATEETETFPPGA